MPYGLKNAMSYFKIWFVVNKNLQKAHSAVLPAVIIILCIVPPKMFGYIAYMVPSQRLKILSMTLKPSQAEQLEFLNFSVGWI